MMLLIQNIHVFDPEYQGVKDVLITGNTIHKIADSLPVTAAYEMKVIDGTGKFLIPGLIDSHVHIVIVKINSIDNIKVQRSEHIVDYTLIDFPTLCRMIKQNEIVDGFTIGGLFKWYLEMSF